MSFKTITQLQAMAIRREERRKKTAASGCYATIGLEIGRLVDEKNAQYGDSFNRSGNVLRQLYPDGIPTAAYDDMLAVIRIIDKLFRIAHGSQGDESPGRDIAGYGLLITERHKRKNHG